MNDYWDTFPERTVTVHDQEKSAVVKYPKSNGGYFRVRFNQKANPIGFHAKLPGKQAAPKNARAKR